MNTDGPLRLVQVDAGGLGRARLDTIGANPAQFFKAPHLGGFREEMDHVLLLDMAIHPFIAVRHVTGQDAVGVSCEKFNPSWSWFKSDAAATASFEFAGGLRSVYSGSWRADGAEMSWNGSWCVNRQNPSQQLHA